MTYSDDTDNEFETQMNQLTQYKRDLRRREKELMARDKAFQNIEQYGLQNIGQFRKNLKSSLPAYMIPSNVGGLNEVSWPFWYKMEFDLGAVATFNSSIRQTQSFQVTQEAAFLLMSIVRTQGNPFVSNSAPVQIDLIDRQSSRRFNSAPVPVQMIGIKSNPTILPTPMLIMPNAFFEGTISSIATASTYGFNWAMNFDFFGYRVRVEDADKVLSTIFG